MFQGSTQTKRRNDNEKVSSNVFKNRKKYFNHNKATLRKIQKSQLDGFHWLGSDFFRRALLHKKRQKRPKKTNMDQAHKKLRLMVRGCSRWNSSTLWSFQNSKIFNKPLWLFKEQWKILEKKELIIWRSSEEGINGYFCGKLSQNTDLYWRVTNMSNEYYVLHFYSLIFRIFPRINCSI